MNYYMININTFATTDKSKITYLHKSIDETKYMIVTNEILDGVITEFESASALEEYTKEYPSGWVGDNTCITEEEMEEIEYIEGL
jgi:hypothetical protein